jgi:integrase
MFQSLQGTQGLILRLLYGSGMRLLECLRLRVQDLHFERKAITVRNGKGQKDRVTLLPAELIPALQRQLSLAKAAHQADLAEGYGEVYLPYALERKYPNANKEWGWQYVFFAAKPAVDPRSGKTRRHHLDQSVANKALKQAKRQADVHKLGSCHSLRHKLRHPPTGRWPRHPYRADPARPQRRQDHHDLHPCAATGAAGGKEPVGAVGGAVGVGGGWGESGGGGRWGLRGINFR